MKTKFVIYLFALACGVTVLVKYVSDYRMPKLLSLSQMNIEALTEDEYDRNWCLSESGNWNMASVCVDSGFEKCTCKVTGKIVVFGVELSGSYETGQEYSIAWCRYQCQPSDENCCTKQGLYTGEIKLA